MSAERPQARGAAAGRQVARVRLAYLAAVALFLWVVAQFYQPVTGFSSLIAIGDASNPKVTALQQVPHYEYENSSGYDGAYYVQIALYPMLDNPELIKAIDNLPYRARRILFCWVAWLLGLGQPAWIVQAHALLNVICWLALAAVLLRWFPPTDWQNFLRWFAVMFSHGLCMSVRDSLVDGPSLLLVALAMAWLESGRRGPATALLALAGLGKETNLLAAVGPGLSPAGASDAAWRAPRTWLRWGGRMLLVALPLLVWMGYIRAKFGPADDPGLGNFAAPFTGLAEKWGAVVADWYSQPEVVVYRATALAALAITVQFLFFVGWRRPRDPWWRIGAAFAVMMVFLATPVWEGYPGAFTRVLLPMTLAFNILVPRRTAWLPLLIAGNLTVIAGWQEASPPSREFLSIAGERTLVATVHVKPGAGWFGPEESGGERWRWSSGDAVLHVRNGGGVPVLLMMRGQASSARDERRLRISVGEALVWSETIAGQPLVFQFGRVIPSGETNVTFKTDKPAHTVGEDARKLAFNISNLEVVVKPAPRQR